MLHFCLRNIFMYHFVFRDACDNVKVSEGLGYTHTSSGDKVDKT